MQNIRRRQHIQPVLKIDNGLFIEKYLIFIQRVGGILIQQTGPIWTGYPCVQEGTVLIHSSVLIKLFWIIYAAVVTFNCIASHSPSVITRVTSSNLRKTSRLASSDLSKSLRNPSTSLSTDLNIRSVMSCSCKQKQLYHESD